MKRFRGGLLVKTHRLLHHSTLGWRVIKKHLEGLAELGALLTVFFSPSSSLLVWSLELRGCVVRGLRRHLEGLAEFGALLAVDGHHQHPLVVRMHLLRAGFDAMGVDAMWVVRVGGDDGELRPWHYIYEGRRGRWGTPTMALHIRIQHVCGGSTETTSTPE